MPDFFEKIKAVQYLLAFLTLYPYLLRNLRLVVGCVIFAETSWYGPRKLFVGLKNRWW